MIQMHGQRVYNFLSVYIGIHVHHQFDTIAFPKDISESYIIKKFKSFIDFFNPSIKKTCSTCIKAYLVTYFEKLLYSEETEVEEMASKIKNMFDCICSPKIRHTNKADYKANDHLNTDIFNVSY